ncbi:hypothetical protein SNE40_010228 [Patella caerulea]|uniref:Hint domain-containing protein n=1 Tax=Patella caerulea TaxID=87958 RepID=A0AAN8JUT9_PATCE
MGNDPVPNYDINRRRNCLTSNDWVITKDGERKYLQHLKAGEEVQEVKPDGTLGYTKVYCFSHKDPHQSSPNYLEIITGTRSITISNNHHLVFTDDESNSSRTYKMAKEVKIGDRLVCHDGQHRNIEQITNIKEVEGKGAFAPITKSGELLVNGIQVSCYSSADPNLVHAALTLFRLAYDVTPTSMFNTLLWPNENGNPYIFGATVKLYNLLTSTE